MNIYEGFFFFSPSPAFDIGILSNDGLSECEMLPHCCSDLLSLIIRKMHLLMCYWSSLFGEMAIYLSILPIFDWVIWSFVIELYELFIYFPYQALVGYIIYKYFLSFCRWSFYFVYGILCYAKAFSLFVSFLIFLKNFYYLGTLTKVIEIQYQIQYHCMKYVRECIIYLPI